MQKKRSVPLLWISILSTLLPRMTMADWEMNLKPGVTPVSQEIFRLHSIALWIVFVIAAIVIGAIIWSVLFHRKSRGVTAATWHENLAVEVIWTVVPFVILVIMAVPATRTLIKMENTTGDIDLTIKATGYQWMWSYDYIDEGFSFYSKIDDKDNTIRQLNSGQDPFTQPNYLYQVDKEMVIPVNKKVRLLTTAADVIHSWWVPQLGGKKDAIPGFINEMWIQATKEGVYRGSCAELCGKDHAFMPIVVRVVSEEEYRNWVSAQKSPMAKKTADQTAAIATLDTTSSIENEN